ncbi:hypothetical protein L195_g027770 [Trifolium pratense]|uniref:Uncharacterized protein n=1 Tax=Trifolium pratense TaxID=57577 RepID=A0A2K3L014_TRIPR|nr:hypothetical protein L195_g027770 [Trifolium pratense]
MAQWSCAWRNMNVWKGILDLGAAPWRQRPAQLRRCNCLFAPGCEGLRMAQLKNQEKMLGLRRLLKCKIRMAH